MLQNYSRYTKVEEITFVTITNYKHKIRIQVNQNVVHSLDKLLVIAWQMCKRNGRGYKGYKGCFNIFPKHTLISFYISGPHNMEYIITQSGRGYKGLQSLSGCHFYQKRSNILIFYIVGGMCASSRCQSFKIQLNFLPANLIATG